MTSEWQAAYLVLLNSTENEKQLFIAVIMYYVTCFKDIKCNYVPLKSIKNMTCCFLMNRKFFVLAKCCGLWRLKHCRTCSYWKKKTINLTRAFSFTLHHNIVDYFHIAALPTVICYLIQFFNGKNLELQSQVSSVPLFLNLSVPRADDLLATKYSNDNAVLPLFLCKKISNARVIKTF